MKKRILTAIAACVSSVTLAHPHPIPLCPNPTDINTLVESSFNQHTNTAALSVYVSRPGCPSYQQAFGDADVKQHAAATTDTLFPFASGTKPIMMVMILKIMADYPENFPQGLDTKLTDIRDHANKPLFRADGQFLAIDGTPFDLNAKNLNCSTTHQAACVDFSKIDVRHLLIESSGISDFMRQGDGIWKFIASYLTSPLPDPGSLNYESDLSILRKTGLSKIAEPDPVVPTQSHNTDYTLLSLIAKRVTNMPLNDLLSQYIIHPLHLGKNDILFLDSHHNFTSAIARRYTLLNTDASIDEAIQNGTIFKGLPDTLVNLLRPSKLESFGRDVVSLKDGSLALDVLALQGQGLSAFPGAAGITATPHAIARFYKALNDGKIFDTHAQRRLYHDSFMPAPAPVNLDGYTSRVGFASNIELTPVNDKVNGRLIIHPGFVLGGEALELYQPDTKTTVTIATNTSGAWRNQLPGFYVTATPNFDQDAIFNLALALVSQYATG